MSNNDDDAKRAALARLRKNIIKSNKHDDAYWDNLAAAAEARRDQLEWETQGMVGRHNQQARQHAEIVRHNEQGEEARRRYHEILRRRQREEEQQPAPTAPPKDDVGGSSLNISSFINGHPLNPARVVIDVDEEEEDGTDESSTQIQDDESSGQEEDEEVEIQGDESSGDDDEEEEEVVPVGDNDDERANKAAEDITKILMQHYELSRIGLLMKSPDNRVTVNKKYNNFKRKFDNAKAFLHGRMNGMDRMTVAQIVNQLVRSDAIHAAEKYDLIMRILGHFPDADRDGWPAISQRTILLQVIHNLNQIENEIHNYVALNPV